MVDTLGESYSLDTQSVGRVSGLATAYERVTHLVAPHAVPHLQHLRPYSQLAAPHAVPRVSPPHAVLTASYYYTHCH